MRTGTACLTMLVALSAAGRADKVETPRAGMAIDVKRHRDFVETLGPEKFEMLAIPGGTYLRGSPDDEPGRKADEGPRHPVRVLPFWMAKVEMTWPVFDLYAVRRVKPVLPPDPIADPIADAVTRPSPSYADPTWGYGHKSMPVISVTHHSAMEFCRWLRARTGKPYRLPTEAEWEWACRAGSASAYSFGDDPAKLGEYASYEKNRGEDDGPTRVGSRKPNAWGLHDMHGNVAEWCLDRYEADAYAKLPGGAASLLPFVPLVDDRFGQVVRGGSWVDRAETCRSAARRVCVREWNRRDPERPQSIWWLTDADFVGFRVVCPVDDPIELREIRSPTTRR